MERPLNVAELDHEALFSVTSALRGDFLMTYDDTAFVRDLAARHGFSTHLVAMKNTHHAKMTELLIGKNLSWLRKAANDRESASRNAQVTLAFHQ